MVCVVECVFVLVLYKIEWPPQKKVSMSSKVVNCKGLPMDVIKKKIVRKSRKMTEEETVTVTYSCTLKKSDIEEDPTHPGWKDSTWEKIKALRNIDDTVVLQPNANTNEAFKKFGNFNVDDLHQALRVEVATIALLKSDYGVPQ